MSLSALHDRPTPTRFSRRTALRFAAASLAGAGVAALPVAAGTAEAAGYTKPTWDNTGVPAGVSLSRHNGDIVVTTAGTVLNGLDIYGRVLIRAANVTVKNCRIRGTNSPSNNTGLVDCNHSAVRNALIQNCLLQPDTSTVWLTGVIGKEYTAKGNNVYRTVDGFGAYNATDRSAPTNVRIESNYIHDLSWFANDPNHSDGTHNDGIQVQGGSNVQILGNNIECFMSTGAGDQNYPARNIGQGILIQPNVAPITGSAINYNWIDGGKASLYVVRGSLGSMKFGSCTGNRFGRNQYKFNGTSQYQIRVKTGVTFSTSLTGNVWDANSKALAVSSTGGIRYDA